MSESARRHKLAAPSQIGFALVMCSTSRFTQSENGCQVDDPSGDLIVHRLTDSGHEVISRVLVPDNQQRISHVVSELLDNRAVEAVIVCGGTGISPQDLTIETVEPMLEKVLPGFGELFRKLSYDTIGSAAILSRAAAGLTRGKVIFCIPGSLQAVELCLDKLILPETGHIVKHAREKA